MKAMRAWAERDGRGYPDWAIRYLPVRRQLEPWLRGEPVLEIGANANGMARFVQRPVIAVDLSMQSLRESRSNKNVLPVRADIAHLPFADGALGACICMDTFEHLPAELRSRASAEVLRVLHPQGAAAIGFPSGAPAARAEARVRNAYARHTGGAIRWLEEHADNGLPDADAIGAELAALARGHWTVTRAANANVWVWEGMWRILMCGWPGRGNSVAQAFLRIATPLLARMHFGPCYRAIFYLLPAPKL